MSRLKKNLILTEILGILSLVFGVFGAMALTDIYHARENDLRLEWWILRAGALVFLAFIISTMITIRKARRELG